MCRNTIRYRIRNDSICESELGLAHLLRKIVILTPLMTITKTSFSIHFYERQYSFDESPISGENSFKQTDGSKLQSYQKPEIEQ